MGYIFDIDGNFTADYGTDKCAKRVQYLLQEGKVSLDVVIEIYGNTGDKKSRIASKAEVDEFNRDDEDDVDGGDKDVDVGADYNKIFF